MTVSSDANVIHAGAGDDVILIAHGADAIGDTLDGGANNDVIRFISTTPGDLLALNGNTTNVETIEASDAAGAVTGTAALTIDASAVSGPYTLIANNGGGDTLFAGSGTDTITGGTGNDLIHAGTGLDTINAGDGSDTVFAVANAFNDSFNGGSGNDTIDYSALSSLQGISLLTSAPARPPARQSVRTPTAFENINSGAGDDSLFGSTPTT